MDSDVDDVIETDMILTPNEDHCYRGAWAWITVAVGAGVAIAVALMR